MSTPQPAFPGLTLLYPCLCALIAILIFWKGCLNNPKREKQQKGVAMASLPCLWECMKVLTQSITGSPKRALLALLMLAGHVGQMVYSGTYFCIGLLCLELCIVGGLTFWLGRSQSDETIQAVMNEAAVRLVALRRQNEDLTDIKQKLEAELHYLVQHSHTALRVGSPADLILEVLDLILDGGVPNAEDLLLLRDFVLSGNQHHDMYQPLDLSQQLHALTMEPDVEEALCHQLLGSSLTPKNAPVSSSLPSNIAAEEDKANNAAHQRTLKTCLSGKPTTSWLDVSGEQEDQAASDDGLRNVLAALASEHSILDAPKRALSGNKERQRSMLQLLWCGSNQDRSVHEKQSNLHSTGHSLGSPSLASQVGRSLSHAGSETNSIPCMSPPAPNSSLCGTREGSLMGAASTSSTVYMSNTYNNLLGTLMHADPGAGAASGTMSASGVAWVPAAAPPVATGQANGRGSNYCRYGGSLPVSSPVQQRRDRLRRLSTLMQMPGMPAPERNPRARSLSSLGNTMKQAQQQQAAQAFNCPRPLGATLNPVGEVQRLHCPRPCVSTSSLQSRVIPPGTRIEQSHEHVANKGWPETAGVDLRVMLGTDNPSARSASQPNLQTSFSNHLSPRVAPVPESSLLEIPLDHASRTRAAIYGSHSDLVLPSLRLLVASISEPRGPGSEDQQAGGSFSDRRRGPTEFRGLSQARLIHIGGSSRRASQCSICQPSNCDALHDGKGVPTEESVCKDLTMAAQSSDRHVLDASEVAAAEQLFCSNSLPKSSPLPADQHDVQPCSLSLTTYRAPSNLCSSNQVPPQSAPEVLATLSLCMKPTSPTGISEGCPQHQASPQPEATNRGLSVTFQDTSVRATSPPQTKQRRSEDASCGRAAEAKISPLARRFSAGEDDGSPSPTNIMSPRSSVTASARHWVKGLLDGTTSRRSPIRAKTFNEKSPTDPATPHRVRNKKGPLQSFFGILKRKKSKELDKAFSQASHIKKAPRDEATTSGGTPHSRESVPEALGGSPTNKLTAGQPCVLAPIVSAPPAASPPVPTMRRTAAGPAHTDDAHGMRGSAAAEGSAPQAKPEGNSVRARASSAPSFEDSTTHKAPLTTDNNDTYNYIPSPTTSSRPLSQISTEGSTLPCPKCASTDHETADLYSLSKVIKDTNAKSLDTRGPELIAQPTQHSQQQQEPPHSQEQQEQAAQQAQQLMQMASPKSPLMSEVEIILGRACSSFSFDAFELAEVTQGHPLSTLAYYLLHKGNFISSFGLHPIKLARFLRTIEAGYPVQNPYHNPTHAADVLQTLHVIIHRGGMVPHLADRLSVLAALLAAIMHDYEHMGLTNDFLVNSSSTLAIRYNDRAPLENHHLAAGFTVLGSPDKNFLSSLPKVDYSRLRKVIIDLVLATDMKQHFALVGQFNAVVRRVMPRTKQTDACPTPGSPNACALKKQKSASRALTSNLSMLLDQSSVLRGPRREGTSEMRTRFPQRMSMDVTETALSQLRAAMQESTARPGSNRMTSISAGKDARSTQSFVAEDQRTSGDRSTLGDRTTGGDQSTTGDARGSNASTNHKEPASLDESQKLLLLQIALKCADLGHVAEDHDVHIRWVHCLEEEFYRQGDLEKLSGLPLSPLFDRAKPGVTKSQVGFFDVVVLPLYQALASAMPGLQPLLQGVESNYKHWKGIGPSA